MGIIVKVISYYNVKVLLFVYPMGNATKQQEIEPGSDLKKDHNCSWKHVEHLRRLISVTKGLR